MLGEGRISVAAEFTPGRWRAHNAQLSAQRAATEQRLLRVASALRPPAPLCRPDARVALTAARAVESARSTLAGGGYKRARHQLQLEAFASLLYGKGGLAAAGGGAGASADVLAGGGEELRIMHPYTNLASYDGLMHKVVDVPASEDKQLRIMHSRANLASYGGLMHKVADVLAGEGE